MKMFSLILAFGVTTASADTWIYEDYMGVPGVTKIYEEPDYTNTYVPIYDNNDTGIYVPNYDSGSTTCFSNYMGVQGVTKCY